MKEKILEGAEKLFFQFGVRSVSMDDVARELSMSKKTLYQYFTNKDELVSEMARAHMAAEKQEFTDIARNTSNAIEELFNISICLREHMEKMNPSLIYDLQKYHSKAWQHFLDYKNEFIRGTVIDNIRRGKSEGHYRQEIDEEILSILRVETIQMVFDERFFPKAKFHFPTVQMQVFDHFVHGLLTEKGTQLYKQYQSQEAKQSIS
ncbi:MAG: TetR/AcrR family transcriptional regulator [Cyclobacteriaceae bacterium]